MKQRMDFEKAEKIIHDLASLPVFIDNVFLTHGTLLGAYRDKGFTPQEVDIDFGFLYEKFKDKYHPFLQGILDLGFDYREIKDPFTRVRAFNLFRDGIKVDVSGLVYARLSNGRRVRFGHNTLKPPAPVYACVYPNALLRNQSKIEFFGHEWNCPSEVEKYLEGEYGREWVTPKRDSVSRTRINGFMGKFNINPDHLERWD